MSSPNLAVNEIFGPTFQGEGKLLGQPCVFLRLAGCNLACSWCDSKYTWDWDHYDPRQEIHRMTWGAALKALLDLAVDVTRHLVISGGEPMLQQANLLPLSRRLRDGYGWVVELETAGTIAPLDYSLASLFNVSPKLAHSGNPLEKRYHPEVLIAFRKSHLAVFKFVVQSPADFTEIDQIVHDCSLDPATVYIMPEGVNASHLEFTGQAILHEALLRGFNLTTRLHIMLYGNLRGV